MKIGQSNIRHTGILLHAIPMQYPCFLKCNFHQGLLLTDRGTSWPDTILTKQSLRSFMVLWGVGHLWTSLLSTPIEYAAGFFVGSTVEMSKKEEEPKPGQHLVGLWPRVSLPSPRQLYNAPELRWKHKSCWKYKLHHHTVFHILSILIIP